MGQLAQDKAVLCKTQIEQAVRLVDCDDPDTVRLENALFEVVDDASRRANDDIDPFFEDSGLFLVVDPADDLGEGQAGVRSDQHGLFVNL